MACNNKGKNRGQGYIGNYMAECQYTASEMAEYFIRHDFTASEILSTCRRYLKAKDHLRKLEDVNVERIQHLMKLINKIMDNMIEEV